MELGFLIQFIDLGQVLSTSGLLRTVGFSWTYRVVGTPPAAADKHNYYVQFGIAVEGPFLGVMNSSLINFNSFVLYPNTPGDVATLINAGQAGAVVGPRLPLHQAAYVSLGTALRGRPFRGSKRIGPLNESDIAGDELTPAAQAAYQNVCLRFRNPFNVTIFGGGVQHLVPVVWSRQLSSNDTTVPPGIGADVTAVEVQFTVSTWRHRKERVVR